MVLINFGLLNTEVNWVAWFDVLTWASLFLAGLSFSFFVFS